MAPVAEELFFRGVLYSWIRRRWSSAVGMLSSAAIFAGVHLQPQMMPEIFLVGVTLAWLYECSNSLYTGILLHMTLNIITFIWLFTSLATAQG